MLPLILFCMLGVPLPSLRPKLVDERFPCEHCPCGCNTAAHCWDKCCCFSDEQKLDWAVKNNVSPPRFLVKRVAAANKNRPKSDPSEAIVQRASGQTGKTCSCCQANKKASPVESSAAFVQSARVKSAEIKFSSCPTCKTQDAASGKCCSKGSPPADCQVMGSCPSIQKACCCKNSNPSQGGCCSAKSKGLAAGDSKSSDAEEAKPTYKIVLLDSAFKCQGIQLALLLFKSALTPATDQLEFASPVEVGQLALFDQVATSIYIDLDGPVPRLGA